MDSHLHQAELLEGAWEVAVRGQVSDGGAVREGQAPLQWQQVQGGREGFEVLTMSDGKTREVKQSSRSCMIGHPSVRLLKGLAGGK